MATQLNLMIELDVDAVNIGNVNAFAKIYGQTQVEVVWKMKDGQYTLESNKKPVQFQSGAIKFDHQFHVSAKISRKEGRANFRSRNTTLELRQADNKEVLCEFSLDLAGYADLIVGHQRLQGPFQLTATPNSRFTDAQINCTINVQNNGGVQSSSINNNTSILSRQDENQSILTNEIQSIFKGAVRIESEEEQLKKLQEKNKILNDRLEEHNLITEVDKVEGQIKKNDPKLAITMKATFSSSMTACKTANAKTDLKSSLTQLANGLIGKKGADFFNLFLPKIDDIMFIGYLCVDFNKTSEFKLVKQLIQFMCLNGKAGMIKTSNTNVKDANNYKKFLISPQFSKSGILDLYEDTVTSKTMAELQSFYDELDLFRQTSERENMRRMTLAIQTKPASAAPAAKGPGTPAKTPVQAPKSPAAKGPGTPVKTPVQAPKLPAGKGPVVPPSPSTKTAAVSTPAKNGKAAAASPGIKGKPTTTTPAKKAPVTPKGNKGKK